MLKYILYTMGFLWLLTFMYSHILAPHFLPSYFGFKDYIIYSVSYFLIIFSTFIYAIKYMTTKTIIIIIMTL